MSEIAKTYEPAAVEAKWYDYWLQAGCFTADPASSKPAYSIVIPPPNVTGVLHLGHILNNTIQDILARRARMLGKEVLWLPGTDHAGIATQNVVEKALRKAGEMKHRDELGREALVAKIWEWREKYGGVILQQLKALGCSLDWSRTRFTMDEAYSRCVTRVFVDLYKKGLIYRGKRMVNWCPVSLTALSDEEVIMKPQNGTMYHFRVEVAEEPGTWLTIATTRPETIPGDTAVAVNPKDSRYAHLIGKHILRPLPVHAAEAEKRLPIIGDEHVEFEFGTGVLKVTPAHDKADFEIGLRHGLPVVDIMNPDGTMNALAGESLVGLDRFEARNVAVDRLRELGVLEKEEPYQNNVGYSERADVPIEPRLSEQWFLKYPSVEAAKACVLQPGGLKDSSSGQRPGATVQTGTHPEWVPETSAAPAGADSPVTGTPRVSPGATIRQPSGLHTEGSAGTAEGSAGALHFFPDRWAKVYDHWMTGIQDWCISRQLWWGHRIPVWYRNGETYSDEEPPAGDGWTQDPDVLDTWFSSWLWPFATMGWPEKTPTLAKFYPTTDLVTGPDIIFFWVARMIMAGFEWMGEMPFRNVYFTGIIRDKQGRKMSKSLGNSPDPLDLIAKYGADALRFGVMRSAPLGADVIYDEKNVELGRNFCTKLWNAVRFRQMQGGEVEGEIDPKLLSSDDQWILLRLDAAIREISTALDGYLFTDATQAIYRFFWSEFCDWYLEAAKAALTSDQAARKANTLAVLDFVLGHTLRLMHPFLPFITEELWHGLGFNEDLPPDQGGRTIMLAHWPAPLDDDFKAHYGLSPEAERFASAKYEVVNHGRALRRDFNIASNKRIRFVFRPATPLPDGEAAVLKLLLNAEALDIVTSAWQPPKGTPTALTPLGELLLPLEGLVDAAAERERLGKEIAKVQAELGKVRAKLDNPSFAAKVPVAVLDEHRQRESGWSDKLAQLQRMLDALS